MIHKTAELTGALLDLAVHKALELSCYETLTAGFPELIPYSTSWAIGGPIIERERIRLLYEHGEGDDAQWYAACRSFEQIGTTPLIAAMRAFVAHKLGDEVEL